MCSHVSNVVEDSHYSSVTFWLVCLLKCICGGIKNEERICKKTSQSREKSPYLVAKPENPASLESCHVWF